MMKTIVAISHVFITTQIQFNQYRLHGKYRVRKNTIELKETLFVTKQNYNTPENHSVGILEDTLCLQDNTSSALPTEINKESKQVVVRQKRLNKKLNLLDP